MRSSLAPYILSGRSPDETTRLYEQSLAKRVAVVWLDNCSDLDAALVERIARDQIDQMKRESQVQSNVERLR